MREPDDEGEFTELSPQAFLIARKPRLPSLRASAGTRAGQKPGRIGRVAEPFAARFATARDRFGPLVLGADPHAAVLASWNLPDDAEGLERFTDIVLAAASGAVGLVKPQSAFYERHGWRGVRALTRLTETAREQGLLVIMDVKMPRRDGIDAASEIASKRIAPIVVLTAFSQRDLVERARDAGAMAYLVKPFTISDLIPAIELAVSRFSEFTELEREVATLSDRLETRKLVERAKGLLQAKQGMTEPEAFKWIQRAAMDRRTTMKRVAEVVLETLGTAEE